MNYELIYVDYQNRVFSYMYDGFHFLPRNMYLHFLPKKINFNEYLDLTAF